MSAYQPQVQPVHYRRGSYRAQDRWDSYWHQIDLVERTNPEIVLEVGAGEGVVARELTARGIATTTLDIAENLHPDVVGSVTDIPLKDETFDVVLAAEVLEHIRFEDVPQALREMVRVARTHVVVSVPHPGWVFSFTCKLPLVPRLVLFGKLPFFWQTHAFNGQHYWELGKRGFPVRRLVDAARHSGLELIFSKVYVDDPAHRFFVFKKV